MLIPPRLFPPHHHLQSSVRIWLCTDICDSLFDTVNDIRLLVRYLNAKFLLNGHDHFDGIQAVQAKVVREVRCAGDL